MNSVPLVPPPPNSDVEHLRLLALFHYILGGIGAVFATLPVLHIGMGLLMLLAPEKLHTNAVEHAPPEFIGYLFIGMGAFAMIIGWSMAICIALSGRFLSKQRNRLFSFVVACVNCIFVPFGTVLGVFTLIVLSRESVIRLYAESSVRK